MRILTSFTFWYLINVICVFIVLFMERKSPTSTLVWVFILLFVPFLGFVFYLLLAQNFSRKELFSMKTNAKRTFGNFLKLQETEFREGQIYFNDIGVEKHLETIKMNLYENECFFTQDNQVKIFTDGHDLYNDMFEEFEKAEKSIHVLFYIIKNDDLGNRFLDLLKKKAEEGVRVRIIYDSMGGREIKRAMIKDLQKSGVLIGSFFPSPFPLFNSKANYRNHRKIVVIDGDVGYCGGFNVGDEYLGKSKKFGYWRDTHVKIRGSACIDLQRRFFLDWSNVSKEKISFKPKYFPQFSDETIEGDCAIQIVSSGPDMRDEVIKQNYIKLINSAKKSVYIQTPYFAPDDSLLDAIKLAALSGVDVNIMIPNKPDHPFVYWATFSFVGDLLKYGVNVYTYENGFMHSKVLIVDEQVVSIGSANFDIRSFRLDFETNAIIYDTQVAKNMIDIYNEDILLSSKLVYEIYLQRGINIRIKESISRLFTPVL